MKTFIIYVILMLAAVCNATILQVDLPYFNLNPTTNRPVQWQAQTPVVGNNFTTYSDGNGSAWITNIPVGLVNITILAPPARTFIQVNMLAGDSGTINASNRLASGASSTYPAGQVAWAIATSDTRYQLNGITASNTFYPLFNNPSNYVQNYQLLNASNALLNIAGAVQTNGYTSIVLSNPASYVTPASLLDATNRDYAAWLAAVQATNLVLASTKQPANATLTNLSATGAWTNSLVAGTNVTLATNAGIVTINVPTPSFLTNGFTDKAITNGLATTNFVTNAVSQAINTATNGFTDRSITNTYATTNYVNSATNGIGIASGLMAFQPTNTWATYNNLTNAITVTSNGITLASGISATTATNISNGQITNLAALNLNTITTNLTAYGGANSAFFKNGPVRIQQNPNGLVTDADAVYIQSSLGTAAYSGFNWPNGNLELGWGNGGQGGSFNPFWLSKAGDIEGIHYWGTYANFMTSLTVGATNYAGTNAVQVYGNIGANSIYATNVYVNGAPVLTSATVSSVAQGTNVTIITNGVVYTVTVPTQAFLTNNFTTLVYSNPASMATLAQLQGPTNLSYLIGQGNTNLTYLIGQGDTNYILLTGLGDSNNVITASNAITTAFRATNAIAHTDLTNLYNSSIAALIASNLVVLNTVTNGFVQSTNGIASTLTIKSNTVLWPFPWMTYSTNVVGINAAGVLQANGTYIQTATASTWTNIAGNGSDIIFQNPTYFLRTNLVNLYSTGNLFTNGGWLDVIGSTAVPTNSGFGYVANHSGQWDTNVWAAGLTGLVPMQNLDTTKVLTNNYQTPVTINNGLTLTGGGSITAVAGGLIGGISLSPGGIVNATTFNGGIFNGNGGGLTNIFVSNIQTFITTNQAINTNELYFTGAGTASANGKYVWKTADFTSGQIFTNTTATGFACEDHGGVGPTSGNNPFVPFYVGPTTNNSSDQAAPMPFWYFSPYEFALSINSKLPTLWTNAINPAVGWAFPTSIGVSPAPTVKWGTNTTYVTNSANVAFLVPRSSVNAMNLYVNATNGNDNVALTYDYPFRTCTAAKNYAASGALITVQAGNYHENDLLKNGVNWVFQKGIIGYDDYLGSGSSRGIFDDYAGAVTSSITGDYLHYSSRSSDGLIAITVTNPLTRINVTFNTADAEDFYHGTGDGFSMMPVPQKVIAGVNINCYLASIVNCAKVNIDIKNIVQGYKTNFFYDYDQNDTDPTTGWGVLKTNLFFPLGFFWATGPTSIHWSSGEFWRPGTLDFNYMLWVTSPTGGGTDNQFNVDADYADGVFLSDGASTSSATWVNIKNWIGPNGFPAITVGGNSKYYFAGDKITAANSAVSGVIGSGLSSADTAQAWFTFQKVEMPSFGGDAVFVNGATTNVFNVGDFKDAGNLSNAICIDINGGVSTFNGGNLTTKGAGLRHRNGLTTLNAMNITATGTNAPILLLTNGLTLNAVTLNPPSGTNGIMGVATASVSVFGGAVKSISPNVTLTNGMSAVGLQSFNTNTVPFTTATLVTNTLGFDATASLSAGTSVIVQDRFGNTVDTVGTVATLHVLIPLRSGMRLSGTGLTGVIY